MFDEREQKEIEFAKAYARDFGHGTPGHLTLTTLAKAATALEALQALLPPIYNVLTDAKPAMQRGEYTSDPSIVAADMTALRQAYIEATKAIGGHD